VVGAERANGGNGGYGGIYVPGWRGSSMRGNVDLFGAEAIGAAGGPC